MTLNNTRSPIIACLTPFARFAAATLLLLSMFRLGMVIWQWDRVSAVGMTATIFLQGIRFDLVTLGSLFLFPLTFTPLLCVNRRVLNTYKPVLRWYFSLAFAALTFMEIATPSFINEYDARPNITFFEYLVYPKEIAMTLWAAYKLQLLLAAVLVPLAGWGMQRLLRNSIVAMSPVRLLPAIVSIPVLFVVCGYTIRSTFDHRAVNPSTVAVSDDPMVNDLCLNSTYTVLYAVYEMGGEPAADFRYADMPERQVIDLVRRDMRVDAGAFAVDESPTMHYQQATFPRKRPLNLVILLEESLGAEFVGSLGGLPLTPYLDKLSAQGWWFENLYATGTRSVRGIEAVITGFPPTTARSVVKLGKSQKNFFTIARILSEQGYHTSFIYGGEAQFDNMRRFFMNNGFVESIDEKDYENPVFVGSWGVSDEDLFNRAHREFEALAAQSKPFFSLVFSSSNHSPFQYPDGRIEPYDKEKNTVHNAVKYADYALGHYIEKAKASNYWNNTVFLIVADHNSRVFGDKLVPVEHFHIPALILGGGIAPAVFKPVASQLDLPPTLLSLIGVSSEHPMIGHDLTRPEFQTLPGRAIMQYYGTEAYLRDDDIVIMKKDLPIRQFKYRDGELIETGVNSSLRDEAVANSIWPSLAYQQKLYRMPQQVYSTAAPAPGTTLARK